MEPLDAKQIAEGLIEFERRCKLMEASYYGYLEQHPHKWIALMEADVLVIAESLEALMMKIDSQGYKREGAVIRHLDPNPPKIKL